jgi:hypothetical protein
MPAHLLVSTDSTARRMDAVMAIFGTRSRDDTLDAPHLPTSARPRCVAAFIGATQTAGRAGRMLSARVIHDAPRLASTAEQPPRGPSNAETTSACGHSAAGTRGRPPGRSPIHDQED